MRCSALKVSKPALQDLAALLTLGLACQCTGKSEAQTSCKHQFAATYRDSQLVDCASQLREVRKQRHLLARVSCVKAADACRALPIHLHDTVVLHFWLDAASLIAQQCSHAASDSLMFASDSQR